MKIFIALALIVLTQIVRAQPASDEKKLIQAAVLEYLEGRNTGDVGRLANAFMPSATLKGVSKAKELVVTPISDYLARQTPSKRHTCTTEISFIDYTNEVAIAKVIIKYATYAYHDYLVLMKIGDKWIITDKIYTKKEFQS